MPVCFLNLTAPIYIKRSYKLIMPLIIAQVLIITIMELLIFRSSVEVVAFVSYLQSSAPS